MEFINTIELRGVVGMSRLTNCGATKACSFSLVTEYAYKNENDGGVVVDTMWWSVMAYGPKPGWPDLEKIKQGSKVHVIGRLRRRYTDADGCDRQCWDVVAQELEIVGD